MLERLWLAGGREHGPAGRAQPNPVLDHAGGDAIDVRHELAAQPHGVGLTGLPLLRRPLGCGRRKAGREGEGRKPQ